MVPGLGEGIEAEGLARAVGSVQGVVARADAVLVNRDESRRDLAVGVQLKVVRQAAVEVRGQVVLPVVGPDVPEGVACRHVPGAAAHVAGAGVVPRSSDHVVALEAVARAGAVRDPRLQVVAGQAAVQGVAHHVERAQVLGHLAVHAPAKLDALLDVPHADDGVAAERPVEDHHVEVELVAGVGGRAVVDVGHHHGDVEGLAPADVARVEAGGLAERDVAQPAAVGLRVLGRQADVCGHGFARHDALGPVGLHGDGVPFRAQEHVLHHVAGDDVMGDDVAGQDGRRVDRGVPAPGLAPPIGEVARVVVGQGDLELPPPFGEDQGDGFDGVHAGVAVARVGVGGVGLRLVDVDGLEIVEQVRRGGQGHLRRLAAEGPAVEQAPVEVLVDVAPQVVLVAGGEPLGAGDGVSVARAAHVPKLVVVAVLRGVVPERVVAVRVVVVVEAGVVVDGVHHRAPGRTAGGQRGEEDEGPRHQAHRLAHR